MKNRSGILKLLKAGFYTTIQDGGRFGYLNNGVPVSGFMDAAAAKKTNILLDNKPDTCVMEITMTGPTIEFTMPTFICVGGAHISVTLNNELIDHFTVYKIKEGDILSYGKLEKGFRSYLAIKGGFKTESSLGSRSFFTPITAKNHLNDFDEIDYDSDVLFEPKGLTYTNKTILQQNVLDVYQGPEFDSLTNRQLETIFSKTFKVAKENNRMAYQLEETIDGHQTSMLTSATLPGTVQLTPSGKLIILMKDGQTTGGYPRILQLSESAISILAQKKYGDSLNFKLLSS